MTAVHEARGRGGGTAGVSQVHGRRAAVEQQVESGGSGSWIILVVVGVVVVRSRLGSVIREFRAACRYCYRLHRRGFKKGILSHSVPAVSLVGAHLFSRRFSP